MDELKIEYVPIDSIQEYDGNAKQHSERQIEQIAQSIREFGFNDPIAVCKNVIVEGHGRLYAARALGMDSLPIIRLDGLTDNQRRAYTLIHNQLTLNTDFDLDKLRDELEGLLDFDVDMSDFDFDLGSLREQVENVQLVSEFSMDEIEEPNSFDKHSETDNTHFSSEFTFPIEHKAAIISYLRKHKQEIVDEIVRKATEEEND